MLAGGSVARPSQEPSSCSELQALAGVCDARPVQVPSRRRGARPRVQIPELGAIRRPASRPWYGVAAESGMTPRLLEQPPPAPARPATRPPRRRRIGDEQLAGRVADRHDTAFAALYERYHQPLYRYCRSLLHDDADALDAVQSTFTSALVALRAGRRDAPLRPWLFRIAHNEAISLIRRRRVDGHGQELSESLLPSVPSAADEAGARARLALLVVDLTHLPDRQRGALVMRELCGLSHEEIAVALGTSTTAAKQAIFEARTALSEFAEGRATTCEEIRSRLSEQDGRMLRNRRLRSHLRDCSSCDAFAAAIGQRRSDLRAIAPALPLVASAGLLARLARGSGDQGVSGLAAGGAAAGAAGKFGGAALISKGLATIAAALTTVAGVAGLSSTLHSGGHSAHQVGRPQAPAQAVVRSSPAAATRARLGAIAPARPSRTRSTTKTPKTSITRTPAQRRAATKSSRVGPASATAGSRLDAKGPAKPAQTSAPAQQTDVVVTPTSTSSTSPDRTGYSVSSPGSSSVAPGHHDASPGNSASSNGNSGAAPGHSGAAPGHGGIPSGQGGTPPGQTITGPGQAAASPGQSDAAPGNSAAAPGHGGTPPGQLKK